MAKPPIPPPLPRLSRRVKAQQAAAPPASLAARPSGRPKATSIPAAPALPSIPQDPPTPSSVADSKGARAVLVVDDDDAIRRLIVRALRTVYTVYEARDGAEAAELLEAHGSVDCVVLDVMMPRLSGTELAKKMRSDPALRRVPVIFVTAKKSAGEMAEGIGLGARFYLSKPFSLKTLLAKVGEAMAKG